MKRKILDHHTRNKNTTNVWIFLEKVDGNLKMSNWSYNILNEACDIVLILSKYLLKEGYLLRLGVRWIACVSTLCPPISLAICLLSIHSNIHQKVTAWSLSDSQKQGVQGICALYVSYFHENGFVWEKGWPAWSCFYSWPQFCKNLPWNLWLTQRTLMPSQLLLG